VNTTRDRGLEPRDVEGVVIVQESHEVEAGEVAAAVVEVTYSEQGLLAVIRPVLGAVCHLLIVVSNCIPGSAHSHAASAIWRTAFAP